MHMLFNLGTNPCPRKGRSVLIKKDQERFERRLNMRKKNASDCARRGKSSPLSQMTTFHSHSKDCRGNKGIPALEL